MKLEFGRLHVMLKCALKKQLAGLNTSARSFQQVSSGRCWYRDAVWKFGHRGQLPHAEVLQHTKVLQHLPQYALCRCQSSKPCFVCGCPPVGKLCCSNQKGLPDTAQRLDADDRRWPTWTTSATCSGKCWPSRKVVRAGARPSSFLMLLAPLA